MYKCNKENSLLDIFAKVPSMKSLDKFRKSITIYGQGNNNDN